jgi:phage-related protein
MTARPIIWVGSSRADLRRFPEDARRRAGYELYLVQHGIEPSDWKPMPSVGRGVREIRIHIGTEHRVFYLPRFAEGVFVRHAFEKRSRRTPRADIDLARARLAAL